MVEDYKLQIKEIIDETYDTKTFRVSVPEGVPIDFDPGQFFMVRFEKDATLKRAYSVASSPTEKDHLDITMNLVGEFTKKLWEAKVGDELYFQGPYGKFHFNESMKENLVLIGGGVGITPLMGIMRLCEAKNLPNKVNLIYSVKTPADIVYKDELAEINKDNFNHESIITITRPEDGMEWGGRTGRIDRELIESNTSDKANTLFFICGSLEFSKRMVGHLEEMGVSKEQIKTDIWG